MTAAAPKKVPLSDSGDGYAAPEDNFAASGSSAGNIKKLQLDFSHVKESGIDPAGLKMTAINGTKLTTKGKLKDKDSGTAMDSGSLAIVKEKASGQASVSDNTLLISPEEKDSIKIQYNYLNRKYKMTIKVK